MTQKEMNQLIAANGVDVVFNQLFAQHETLNANKEQLRLQIQEAKEAQKEHEKDIKLFIRYCHREGLTNKKKSISSVDFIQGKEIRFLEVDLHAEHHVNVGKRKLKSL